MDGMPIRIVDVERGNCRINFEGDQFANKGLCGWPQCGL